MNLWNAQYHALMERILNYGYDHFDTSRQINTKAIFGHPIAQPLDEGFPAISTKKMAWKAVVGELLWFLKGDTNIKYLVDNNIPIWNKDAYGHYLKLCKQSDITNILSYDDFIRFIKNCQDYHDLQVNSNRNSEKDINGNLPCIPKAYVLGDIGNIYGKQWRDWFYGTWWMNGSRPMPIEKHHDQIANLVNSITNRPDDRGHILAAWNVGELEYMGLRPCHPFTQFNVRGEYLDCLFYMRSSDVFLGLPFNMASYALLTHVLALFTGKKPGNLMYMGGNVHIYESHIDAVKEQLSRDVNAYQPPTLKISDKASAMISSFTSQSDLTLDDVFNKLEISDFTLEGYESFGSLKAEMLAKVL